MITALLAISCSAQYASPQHAVNAVPPSYTANPAYSIAPQEVERDRVLRITLPKLPKFKIERREMVRVATPAVQYAAIPLVSTPVQAYAIPSPQEPLPPLPVNYAPTKALPSKALPSPCPGGLCPAPSSADSDRQERRISALEADLSSIRDDLRVIRSALSDDRVNLPPVPKN